MEPLGELSDLYSPIYWNVGFVSRPNKFWWDIFLKEHFNHCFAWGYLAHRGDWIVVNPTHEKTIVAVVRDQDLLGYLDVIAPSPLTVLQVKSGISPVYNQRILQNCSSVVARVIGLKGLALTPAMLFKTLMANNAKVKSDPYNVNQSQSPGRRSRNKSP